MYDQYFDHRRTNQLLLMKDGDDILKRQGIKQNMFVRILNNHLSQSDEHFQGP
jgi:hypothetical protein